MTVVEMGAIYCLHFPNNKKYVGKVANSRRLMRRFYEHSVDKNGYAVGNAIRKYGLENVTYSVLAESDDPNELNRLEEHFISTLQTRDHDKGYNISLGGNGGDIFNALPEKQKTELRNAARQRLAERGGMRNSMFGAANPIFGIGHTDATKAKIRAARSRQVFSAETRALWSRNRSGENSKVRLQHMPKSLWLLLARIARTRVIPQKELAELYNVSVRSIQELTAGKHWSQRGL